MGFLLAPWPQMCVVPEAVWLCPISGLVGAEETNEGHASCGRSLKECNLCDNRFQFRRTHYCDLSPRTKWYISRALFLWLLFWNSRAEHMKLSTWLEDSVFYWQQKWNHHCFTTLQRHDTQWVSVIDWPKGANLDGQFGYLDGKEGNNGATNEVWSELKVSHIVGSFKKTLHFVLVQLAWERWERWKGWEFSEQGFASTFVGNFVS